MRNVWLKQGFKHMIVNILVYIECPKDIECMGEVYHRWNRCSSVEDR